MIWNDNSKCKEYKSKMILSKSTKEIIDAIKLGKLAAILAIEGGEALDGNLYMLHI